MVRFWDRVSVGFRRRAADESGATLVTVAISLIVLVGATALAVDGGALWFTRRNLVVDADASALAAAIQQQTRVLAGSSCDQTSAEARATEVVAANDAGSAMDTLTLFCQNQYGKVTVETSKLQEHFFAGIFPGVGPDTDVYARAIAEFGPLVGSDRLKPLPLCAGADGPRTPYYYWKNGYVDPDDAASVPDPTLVYAPTASGIAWKIIIDNDYFNDICNPSGIETSGGFRWIDFDGDGGRSPSEPCPDEGGGGATELKDRFVNGYPCMVYVDKYSQGGNDGPNCIHDPGGWTPEKCPSSTGNVASIINCINGRGGGGCINQICPLLTPAADCQYKWTLLVYDALYEEPGWPSAMTPSFNPIGFVQVVARAAENPGGILKPFIAVEFIGDATGSGVIGGPTTDPSDLHVHGVRLCGAEPDETSCKG